MNDPLEQLKEGVRRFRSEVYPEREVTYREAASSPQRPHTLFITCADSRIDPNALTGAGPGEIFVARNIGNLVPAYGEPTAEGVSAVIEYAVRALGVRHIAICGHSDCGAMKALMNPASLEQLPSVAGWLSSSQSDLQDVLSSARAPHEASDDPLGTLTEQNVLLQMRHLQTHPAVADAVGSGELTLSGWVYEIGTGMVRIVSGDERSFAPVEGDEVAPTGALRKPVL